MLPELLKGLFDLRDIALVMPAGVVIVRHQLRQWYFFDPHKKSPKQQELSILAYEQRQAWRR